MKFSWSRTSLSLLIALAALPALAEEVVFEFKGSASRSTPEFEVEAPWILDWRVTTEGLRDSAVEISLEEAGTSVHRGRVLTTRYPGTGVRMFDEDGRFYFRVNSSFATWTLKVIELTDEEAATYTPRSAESR